MTIQIYNTLAGKKVPFETIEPGLVKIYVCGITAYDFCHIGHARSALVFDMLVRYLRFREYKVTFIRNFTDIDDKIIKRAAEQQTTCEELSERFIREFHADMEALKTVPPDLEPKATEHVGQIIELIAKLVEKGLAYQVGNDVYYRVDNFPEYGKLSGRQLEDMQAGARISVNEEKENPMDFALWKGSKPGEPVWESPWGPGRPGWHIECSAMSREYLGETFDIHGGGKDLIFPHHENEIAQSEGASGCTFARNWIHHGFVTIKDEKMSKSLGNFLTIREVLARHHPETLRLFVFSTHYRTPLDYSEAALKDSGAGLERLYSCIAEVENLPASTFTASPVLSSEDKDKLGSLTQRFQDAMDNDFNTAQALGVIFECVKDLNRLRQQLPSPPPKQDVEFLRSVAEEIKKLSNIMGLLTEPPELFLKNRHQELSGLSITPEEIERLIEERRESRSNKNWQRADEIRDMLLENGIELKDSPEGTTWQAKKD